MGQHTAQKSTVDRNDALVVHGICRLSRFLISVQRNIDVEDIKLGQSPKMVNDGKLLSSFFFCEPIWKQHEATTARADVDLAPGRRQNDESQTLRTSLVAPNLILEGPVLASV